MIRVTIEMLPGGVDFGEGNEILGVMLLNNELATSLKSKGLRGDYLARLWKKRNAANVHASISSMNPSWPSWDHVVVENYPRKAKHVWNLVRQALNEIADKHGGTI